MLLHSSSSAARRGLGSSPQLAPEKITFPRLTIRRTLRFGVGERAECKTGGATVADLPVGKFRIESS